MSEPENKVRFGLAEVAISMMEGPGVYGKVERIPGVVKITTDPDGDSEKFYADDGVYYTVVTNNGYTGEAEFALISDEIKMKIFQWLKDSNGALVEVADAVPQPFALLFRVRGDKRKRYNVFYNVTAERPKSEDKTTEDKSSPTTETMSITMIPTEIDGKMVTKLSIEPTEANKAVIDDWYNEVYLPVFSTATPAPPEGEGGEQATENPVDQETVATYALPTSRSSIAEIEAYAQANGIDLTGCANKAEKLAAVTGAPVA